MSDAIPPVHPGAPAYPEPPNYPEPPAYPEPAAVAAPEYPSAPEYPTAPEAPEYPEPPAYPVQQAVPAARPAPESAPAAPQAPVVAPRAEAQPDEAEADADPDHNPALDLDLDHVGGRVHMADHARKADVTVLGKALLLVPNFLGSLLVVVLVAFILPTPFNYLLLVLWLASGALVFHRPAEAVIARYLLNLRPPLRADLDRLKPIWSEVARRAGVDGDIYDLWIEESDDLNAYAAAGHIVGVTRFSMDRLEPGLLAGVLAHELGHHRGGHAWSSLLGLWYSLPGRFAWRLVRRVVWFAVKVVAAFSVLGALLVVGVVALIVFAVVSTYPWLLLALLSPLLLAAVDRKAELKADLHAAELGFAPAMIEVFQRFQAAEETEAAEAVAAARAAGGGRKAVEKSTVAKLLASHPDNFTRIRQMEDYIAGRG